MKHSTGQSTGSPRSSRARVLAVVNQKGGVGKTTTTISLGAALAVLEKTVLLVDFDPQGNTTGGLGVEKSGLGATIYEVVSGHASPAEAIRPTELSFLSLLPANRDLVGAEVELVAVERREFQLADALAAVREAYDFILIDCPPSLGLLTVNALVAADAVLIPIQCEYFALEGVSELLSTIERVREALNPDLAIDAVLATMWDDRTNLARQVLQDIRTFFGDRVLKAVVPRNVRLGEAPSFGKPILLYDVKSKGSEAYLSAARELLERETARRAVPVRRDLRLIDSPP